MVNSDDDAFSCGSTPSTHRGNAFAGSKSSQIGGVGARAHAALASSLSHMQTANHQQPKNVAKRPLSAGQDGRKRWSEVPDSSITASLPTTTPTVRVPSRQQTSFSALQKGSGSFTHTTNSLTRQSRPMSYNPYSDSTSLSGSHLAAPSDNSSQSSPQAAAARHLDGVLSGPHSAKDPSSLLEELESSLLDTTTFTSLLSTTSSAPDGPVAHPHSESTPSIAGKPYSAVPTHTAGSRRSSFRQAVPASQRGSAPDRHSLDGDRITPTVQSVEMHVIELSRTALNVSFGFSISDGLSEPGVYIRALMPGGIAQMHSKLKPMDRVLQVCMWCRNVALVLMYM